MLNRDQINQYQEHGFLAIQDVLAREVIEAAGTVVDEFVEQSRGVTEHTAVFDLEPGHSAASPRVRRLKEPCAIHSVFDRISRLPAILDIAAELIGPAIRYQGSKLNMKPRRMARRLNGTRILLSTHTRTTTCWRWASRWTTARSRTAAC